MDIDSTPAHIPTSSSPPPPLSLSPSTLIGRTAPSSFCPCSLSDSSPLSPIKMSSDDTASSSSGSPYSPLSPSASHTSSSPLSSPSPSLLPPPPSKSLLSLLHSPYIRNLFHLSFSFLFVFMAFNVAQNFQTSSSHASEGSIGLGILYSCFTATNFVSSPLTSLLGRKKALFLGSLTYCAFVAANISFYAPVLYIFSALEGMGASILWTAQGAYVTSLSTLYEKANNAPAASCLGLFNGLFFAVFQMSQCVGNLLAALLFSFSVENWLIFVVMTSIGAVGSVGLLVLPTPKGMEGKEEETETEREGARDSGKQLSLLSRVFSSLSLFKDPRMSLMIPVMIYSGLTQPFIFGEFPPLIESKSTKFYVLSFLGFCDSLSSFLAGPLSDRLGRYPIFLLGLISHLIAIIVILVWQVQQAEVGVFFALALCLAVGDGIFNTQIAAALGSFFESQGSSHSNSAFANYKLFQAGSSAIAFIYHEHVSLTFKCYLTGGMGILGLICVGIIQTKYGLNGRKEKKEGILEEDMNNSINGIGDMESPLSLSPSGEGALLLHQRSVPSNMGEL